MIILIFFSVLWFWKFGVLKKNKKSFWVKFTLKKEIPQGMSPESHIYKVTNSHSTHPQNMHTNPEKRNVSRAFVI
jgi:hypothetical protein